VVDGVGGRVDQGSDLHGILRLPNLLNSPTIFDPNPLGETFMSDLDALKTEKQALIDKMLAMQQRFIAYEHQHGVGGKDYWGTGGGPLAGYPQEYMAIANRVVDLAHQIVGSSRI